MERLYIVCVQEGGARTRVDAAHSNGPSTQKPTWSRSHRNLRRFDGRCIRGAGHTLRSLDRAWSQERSRGGYSTSNGVWFDEKGENAKADGERRLDFVFKCSAFLDGGSVRRVCPGRRRIKTTKRTTESKKEQERRKARKARKTHKTQAFFLALLFLFLGEEQSRLYQQSFFAYYIVQEERRKGMPPAGEVDLPLARLDVGEEDRPIGEFAA